MASFGPAPPKGGRKLAYSHLVQRAPQKCHFESYNGSDHDIMQKRRLASRVFGFTRHHKPYTNLSLTQPPRGCDAYASDDERLNTDVDGHLKELQRKQRQKEAAIVYRLGADREYQKQKVRNKIEEDWNRDWDRVEFLKEKPHARVRANRSGCDYDIFTLQYKDNFGGQKLKYEDECLKWRQFMRKHYLSSKASSCGNFNILNWQKVKRFTDVLDKPAAPVPPEPSSPRRTRPASPVLSSPKKPVESKEETPVCTGAGIDRLDYNEPPSSEPVCKVREITVLEHHHGLEAR